VDLLAIAVYLASFTSEVLSIVYETWFMLLQFIMPWILLLSSFASSYPIIDWEGMGLWTSS